MRFHVALLMALTVTALPPATHAQQRAEAEPTELADEEAEPTAPPADAAPAPDDPEQAACLQAFRDAQRLRRQGALLGARDAATACGQQHCPEVVKEVCAEWQADISAEIPTVIVTANAPDGTPTTAVRMHIDKVLVAESLDARPIELDPGAHHLLLEHNGAIAIEQQLMLTLGDRDRRVAVTFEAPPPPPAPALVPPLRAQTIADEPEPVTGLHPVTYVGLALGGAGIIVGAIAGGVSLSAADEAHAACPNKQCSEGQRDEYDRALLLSHTATVSLAIGGAGFATALIGWLALSSDGDEQMTTVTLLLAPGLVGMRGRF